MQHQTPLVSVIIVNWNGRDDLDECLKSLKVSKYKNLEIIVVDNGSTDESMDLVKNKYKCVKLIENKENMGFAGGNDVGVKFASGKFIYLLNNDAIICENSIASLVQIMEKDPSIGCCGSKIYLEHDRTLINCAGHEVDVVGFLWARGSMEKDKGNYNHREDIFMSSACSLMIRKDFIDQYGLFDESIFMYGDELELAVKVWGAGYKIVFEPQSIVYHKQSKGSSEKFTYMPTSFKQYYANRNRAKILFKYFPKKHLIKNIHLIIMSLFYWDLFILRHDGVNQFFKSIFSQIDYALKGIMERKEASQYEPERWLKFVKKHTLRDFISFAIDPNKLYLGLNKRL